MPGGAGNRVLAHAQLVASSPSPGTILEEPPTELRLVFSEPLESQVTSLDLVAQGGTELLVRAGEIDPDDPYALVATAPELADGVYSITWRTLSAADGHTIEGFFTFGVGDIEGRSAPVGPGSAHAETDAIGVIGRWLTYIGLLLAHRPRRLPSVRHPEWPDAGRPRAPHRGRHSPSQRWRRWRRQSDQRWKPARASTTCSARATARFSSRARPLPRSAPSRSSSPRVAGRVLSRRQQDSSASCCSPPPGTRPRCRVRSR